MKAGSFSAALAAIAVVPFAPTGSALGQDVDEKLIDEITVTARKREETLQEVPVTISAFGRDDIQQFDLRQLESVSDLTPGFQFKNQGNQAPGRYNTQLQFRGLTTAQFSPSFATGALFIDGVYVLNGGTSLSLMDVERVEVIKGPQAAYFGRNTFGGAVNLITRDPNPENWNAEIALSTSDRSNNDISLFAEGPIVTDQLAVSLGARFYDKEGHYVATDGGRLGDEQTTAYNLAVKWSPTDSLNLKLRYGYSEDDDGAPAQGFISGIQNDNCSGRTVSTGEGPVSPVRYICGMVPDINTAVVSTGRVLSSQTRLPQSVIDAGLTDPATLLPGVPQVTDVGMKRETERLTFTADWTFNDYTVDLVFGRNEQDVNWIRDFDLSDRVNWFSRDPQTMKDTSYELRITSPQDGRVRWLAGVNKYDQEFTSSGNAGQASTSCFSFVSAPLTDDFATCIPGLVLAFDLGLENTDEANVTGIFASVDVDITDQITLIVEGRYQQDEITKGAGLLTPGAPILTESFDKFLPRVIARWQPTDSTNIFLSYAEGQIAGDFNSNFINADDRERQQFIAADPNISESLPAEELKAIELGWKQSWLDGRVQTNLSVYSMEWTGIKGRSSALINLTCRPGDVGTTGCDPADGVMVGDPKQIIDPTTGQLVPFFNSLTFLLPGDADITGLELETWFRPSDDLTVTFNLSRINSEYTDYLFNFVAPFAGFSQMAGNKTPRQPEWSANATITQFMQFDQFDAYVRGEMIYQGKAFVDESNLAYIDDYTLFNLRGGIQTDRYLVELFVKNLLAEDAWSTGARWTDFSSPTQFGFLTAKQGVAVSPQDRREIGIRATYRFGD